MQKIDVKIMLCLISIIVTLFLMYHLQQLIKKHSNSLVLDKIHHIYMKTLYLIFDYPYKYYTFKLFEV